MGEAVYGSLHYQCRLWFLLGKDYMKYLTIVTCLHYTHANMCCYCIDYMKTLPTPSVVISGSGVGNLLIGGNERVIDIVVNIVGG